jgi:predicted DNA-binding transcriptional regulator YafY
VRADRLLSLVLLLQARGLATAQVIAAELEVSVRTVYRDLDALVAAGVPVRTESGPGGGCRLMEGYGSAARPAWHPGVRVVRLASARPLAEPFEQPAGFELAGFWRQWSAEFEASRPRLPVTLRASPRALAVFGEVFGQAAGPALAAALPPDKHGWRVLTLSFEHERAATHRLAGFGDQVEVLAPPSVRAGLVATARQILGRYDAA